MTTKPLLDRFCNRVLPEGDCLVWKGFCNLGYGWLWVGVGQKNRKLLPAHRWIYERAFGSLPTGWQVHHICKNKACVKLDHLAGLSRYDHWVADGMRKPSLETQALATHCKWGHEYTPDNTVSPPLFRGKRNGYRVCRTCRNARARKYRALKRVAV